MIIYSTYLRCGRESFATNNLRSLSRFTGLGYHKLLYHFSRKRKIFYDAEDIIIIRSDELHGRGG